MKEQIDLFDRQLTTTLTRIIGPLTYLAMAICFSVRLREFLFKDFVARYDIDTPYLLLLSCFVVLQEARLWIKGIAAFWENNLPIQTFVMSWWLFYLVTLATSSHVATYKVPTHLLMLCAQLTAIYLVGLASHFLYEKSGGRRGLMTGVSKGLRTFELEGSQQGGEVSHQHIG